MIANRMILIRLKQIVSQLDSQQTAREFHLQEPVRERSEPQQSTKMAGVYDAGWGAIGKRGGMTESGGVNRGDGTRGPLLSENVPISAPHQDQTSSVEGVGSQGSEKLNKGSSWAVTPLGYEIRDSCAVFGSYH